MHTDVKCLASSLLLFLISAITSLGQESISGYGSSPREAINNISMAYVQVSSHKQLELTDGKEIYQEVSGVDTGIVFPKDSVKLIDHGTIWEARISKNLVVPVDANWAVQNITVVNEYHQAPYYTPGGMRVSKSERITSRSQVVNAPSGKTTQTKGASYKTETTSRWNGRYGSTRKKTSRYR